MSCYRATFALFALAGAAASAAAQPAPDPVFPGGMQVSFSSRAYPDRNSTDHQLLGEPRRAFGRSGHGLSGARRSAAWALHMGNYSEAMLALAALARSGDAWAYRQLGWMHVRGFGVAPDSRVAFANFGEAARRGDAPSALALGLAYQLGDGVQRDLTLADYWLARAQDSSDRAIRRDAARLRRRN